MWTRSVLVFSLNHLGVAVLLLMMQILMSSESTGENFSLQLNIFIQNVNYKRLPKRFYVSLLEFLRKFCYLIGWAIAHHPLVCSGLVWSIKLNCILFSPNFWKHICNEMYNIPEKTFKRREFTVQKSSTFEINRQASVHHELQMPNWQFGPRDFSKAWSFNAKTRNKQMKQISDRILLKHLDYPLSISMR